MHSPSLIDKLRDECQLRHYSTTTFERYAHWIRRYYQFHGKTAPRKMGAVEVNQFLTHLAQQGHSASSQNQALNALVFVYGKILNQPLEEIGQFQRAKRPINVPTVLSIDEVTRLLQHVPGTFQLMAGLLYGGGLRLNECLTLRVQDIDFGHKRIVVRRGKGQKDRRTLLPESSVDPLISHLQLRQAQHRVDMERNTGLAPLPDRLRFKYRNGERDFRWQFVFASRVVRGGYRWHCGDRHLQEAVKQAARAAGIFKRVGCHTLRHSFATHLLQSGVDIREVQELMGHNSVRTTMVYLHVKVRRHIQSPLDRVLARGLNTLERSAPEEGPAD